ncbi:hypothetical protein [Algoriphagus sp.]|uniref:hypothetical protein n=1 Tax=Algoriphagus sp. TaxID=1872435 RepID=UPI0025CE2E00|nr:hypothetical protein [Algoriphagus sp.]
MQEKWIFKFKEENLEELLNKEEKDLGIFLSYYFKREGAVAEKVRLKRQAEYLTDFSGNLILEFDLVHFNACLAIHSQKREEMKVEFIIDKTQNQLTLIGPYWPERGNDEI